MVNSAVQDVMQASDVDGVRERIARHSSVLFSPVTEKYFDFVKCSMVCSEAAPEARWRLRSSFYGLGTNRATTFAFTTPLRPSMRMLKTIP